MRVASAASGEDSGEDADASDDEDPPPPTAMAVSSREEAGLIARRLPGEKGDCGLWARLLEAPP